MPAKAPRDGKAVKLSRSATLALIAGIVLIVGLLAGCGTAWHRCDQGAGAVQACGHSDTRHCTVITVSQGDQVFFGGNDDYVNFDSTYWVDPGGPSSYGAIYFGEPSNVQQGFNEMGLAYDANGLPKASVRSHPGRKPVSGGYTSYPIKILQECATVAEVIAWVKEHQWHSAMHDQLHFADATGDAVVISAGPDGRVAFTRKPSGDEFLISTNFNVANPSNGSYPCWRFDRAEELLSQIQGPGQLTVERVASVMDAVHVETPNGWTLYSVVADLPQRIVYIYFGFQYDAPLILNVAEEISRAPAPGSLSAKFPSETVSRANQAFQRLRGRTTRCNAEALAWLGLVAVSLAALLVLARLWHKSAAFWVPIVVVLGPAGLLVWLATVRRPWANVDRAPNLWLRALVETAGDMPPYVVGAVVALLAAVLVPALNQGGLLLLLLIYGLPLAIGLFLYQAPLLSRASTKGYAHTLVRRLPTAIVSLNLALAGIMAVTVPLIFWYLNSCPIGFMTIASWWAFAVLGALLGGLLLYVYHAWTARRGFAAWSVLLWETNEPDDGTAAVSFPYWRRLWLWLLLSFVMLVTGTALGLLAQTWLQG